MNARQPPITHTARLAQVHALLLAAGAAGTTVRALAAATGMTARSIERDLHTLQQPPYNLALTRTGWVYRLTRDPSTPLPPLVLTAGEVQVLLQALACLAATTPTQIEVADAVVQRLTALLGGAGL